MSSAMIGRSAALSRTYAGGGSRLFFRPLEAAKLSTVVSASRKTSRACCAKAWRVRRVFGNASPTYKAEPKYKKRPAIVPAEKVSTNLGCRNL